MKICTSHAPDSGVVEPTNGSRLAYLLGEVRRQKNGAVADFMRFYGERYGLNYGVSLPTVRSLACSEREQFESAEERCKFARLLYKQEVRELRLIALWLVDIESVTSSEDLEFWGRGVINSEVAEEAAFALLYRSELADLWLTSDSVLLQYCAVMALAKRVESLHGSDVMEALDRYRTRLIQLVDSEQHIIPKAVVALLGAAIKSGAEIQSVESLLADLPDNAGAKYIRDEIAWRMVY